MRLFLGLAITAIASLAPSLAPGADVRPRSILVLDQGDTKSPFYYEVFAGLRTAATAGSASPIAIYAENLDLSRFTGETYHDSLQAHLQLKYRDKPIGVLVAVGSATLEYVLRRRAEYWPGIPVVFTMVDETTFSRLNPQADVTGIITRLTVRDMMVASRALVPDLKSVAIAGDRPEIQTTFRHFHDELLTAVGNTAVIDLTGLPMSELRRRVAALPDRSTILYTSIFSDGEGTPLRPTDAVALIAETANRPIVVSAETFVGPGGTGGFVAIPSAIGAAAAKLALRILDGEQPAAVPVTTGDVVRPIFDGRQLARWKVNDSDLPAGSEIRFRDPTTWERYRFAITTVATVIVMQAIMIMGLLYDDRRRRVAEVEARSHLSELAHIDRRATAGELSTSIAHELKQPLSAILANTETAEAMLKSPAPDLAEIKEILADIRRDDERANDIIMRLRGMVTKSGAETENVDINETIRNVIKFLSVQASANGLTLASTLVPEPLLVHGDRIQLQQVIMNLIVNAMEATKEAADGQRKITARAGPVNAASVEVSISDSGAGIPVGELKKIFDPFFTTKQHGMGMGLSIARTIVEAHDGRIWAENEVGGGAVFRLRLPLANANPE